MFSCLERATAARLLLPLLAVTAGIGGCAQQQRQAYTPPPLVVDEAMQRRDFERSIAYYPNGDTVAGVNRFPLRSDADAVVGENRYAAAGYDLVASIGQTIALPFTYLFVPPFAPQVFHGDDVGPSYTAMPPMRPAKPLVNVDGVLVNPETLEVQPPRESREQRHGPMGPNDTEFMSSGPSPASE
jgi:hypothetical protein